MTYTEEQCARDWPASENRAALGVVTLSPLGHAFPGGVKGGDVHWIMNDLCVQVHRVEAMGEGCWGGAYRENRNRPGKFSRHARWIAIDFNAPRHPNGKRGTWGARQIAAIDKILAEYEGCIRWGEHYTSTCDGMHFEINCSPATLARLVKKLKAKRAASASKPTPPPAPAPIALEDDDMATTARITSPDGEAQYVITAIHKRWLRGETTELGNLGIDLGHGAPKISQLLFDALVLVGPSHLDAK